MKGSYCTIDYPTLLLSNCRAAISTPDELDIITGQDRHGTWHVHVVELDEDGRPRPDPLLTSASLTLEDALVDLHRKSSLRAQDWIQSTISSHSGQNSYFPGRVAAGTNCFRSSSPRPATPGIWSHDFMGQCESITDAATQVNSLAETPRLHSTVAYRGETVPALASAVRDSDHPIPAPPRIVVSGQAPSLRGIPPPPPPPPTLGVPAETDRMVGALTPPRSPQMSISAAGRRNHHPEREVVLSIDWPRHGKLNVLTNSTMSATALRDAAVNIVRARHGEFDGVRPEDVTPQALRRLQASVQRVQARDIEWVIDNGVEDLSSLPIAPTEFPRIEVRVAEFGV